jgi:hypothetical protein
VLVDDAQLGDAPLQALDERREAPHHRHAVRRPDRRRVEGVGSGEEATAGHAAPIHRQRGEGVEHGDADGAPQRGGRQRVAREVPGILAGHAPRGRRRGRRPRAADGIREVARREGHARVPARELRRRVEHADPDLGDARPLAREHLVQITQPGFHHAHGRPPIGRS